MKKTSTILLPLILLSSCTNVQQDTKLEDQTKVSYKAAVEDSPIGDNVHSDVYDFIKSYMLKIKPKSQKKLKDEIDWEIKNDAMPDTEYLTGNKGKDQMSSIVETEMSHILSNLCKANPHIKEITLYLKNGESFALGYDSKNWDPFTKKIQDLYCSDKFEALGFLYPDPSKKVGITKITSNDGHVYLKIIKDMYYYKGDPRTAFYTPEAKQYASLCLTKPTEPGHELMGYVRYTVEITP